MMNSLSLFAVAMIVLSGIGAHFIALRRIGRDPGAFWAQVLDRVCLFIALPLLLISSFHTYPPLKNYLPNAAWLIFILEIVWLVVLAIGILVSANPASGRWIAGILCFSPNRYWVLLFLIPFLPAVYFLNYPWLEDIYAGHWVVLWFFFASVMGIAFSKFHSADLASQPQILSGTTQVLDPWPVAMQRQGIALRTIAEHEPSVAHETAAGVAFEWQQRLAALGSPGISAVLCTAVSKLIAGIQDAEDRVATILGPDMCGQEEVLALTATELARRQGETTLIVTASPNPALAQRLTGWLDRVGGEMPARLVDISGGSKPSAELKPDVILTDAETLSDSGLDQLHSAIESDSHSGARGNSFANIGLVVWWNAHEFSGVDAAHVWAVSRRLERLLNTRRGVSARALIFARRTRDRQNSFLGFLAHLLPYPQTARNCHQIATHFARRTHVYLLQDSSRATLQKAVAASSLTGWPTSAPPGFAAGPGAPSLVESAADAVASILFVRPHEVLSLREIICQQGRASSDISEHYVAIAAGDNPYVAFLLNQYNRDIEDIASVNLIGAEGHSDLIRRHLLLGLREVPDTFQRLRANFRWEEEPLREALERLSKSERLRSSPVRSLDSDGRLQRDSLYENQNPGQGAIRSFRIVGHNDQPAVELRNPNVPDQLLFEVDPERLPLEAYPHRVFQSHGRSFRVQEWDPRLASPSGSELPARVDCMPEESGIETWPFSTIRLSQIRPDGERLIFRGVSRYIASVQYSEDVSRVLERGANGVYKNIGTPTVRTTFTTKALMLGFDKEFTSDQFLCAAAVLQCVVPVRTAVEDSALRVVPFKYATQAGLALVDLYPGGIGIVNAMHRDTWLMPTLFEQVAAWLRSIKTQTAMDEIAKSPNFRNRNINIFDAERTLAIFDSTTMKPR